MHRPLIFTTKDSVEELAGKRGYTVPEAVQHLLPNERISGQLFMNILCQHGCTHDAVELLCYLMNPRVLVWWALRCYDGVQEECRLALGRDGMSPEEKRKADLQAKVAEVSDTSAIEQMIRANKQLQEKQAAEAEKALAAPDGMNPAKCVDMVLREVMKAAWDMLTPEERQAVPTPEQHRKATAFWDTARKNFDKAIEPMLPRKAVPVPPEAQAVSGDAIFAEIQKKTSSIGPMVQQEMGKYFPLKLQGLPKPPSKEKTDAALQAARRWLVMPTDDNGRLASEAAALVGKEPEGLLAYLAFWCSAAMVSETGTVPGNPKLAPRGMASLLEQLALLEGGDDDYEARFLTFLRLGIECADGTSTWNSDALEAGSAAPIPPVAPLTPHTRDRSLDLFARRGFGREDTDFIPPR